MGGKTPMKRGTYARKGIELTRDQKRARALKRRGEKDLDGACDAFLIESGLEAGRGWKAQAQASKAALAKHQDERRIMAHKRQDKLPEESLNEMIARDARRKERERLAVVARSLHARGLTHFEDEGQGAEDEITVDE
jgi:hypothetical protein